MNYDRYNNIFMGYLQDFKILIFILEIPLSLNTSKINTQLVIIKLLNTLQR